ncbi:INO80 complex subunit B-like isoform X1 [Centruroides sculpturatus]|uniref:INO80 complex subunit B-like isoform X1 n=1 Tax=Centruroides sculpturatus TaxID=218467 RepID=UPI000C6D6112|nr:INO80 complex subunit B-like isoform X1 [Centruroides sculpturatus]
MVLPKRKEMNAEEQTDENVADEKQKKIKTEQEKDEEVVAGDGGMLPHKKHKKHKHKKHKRKKGSEQDAEDGSGSPTASEGGKPPLKLKIKIGGQTFGEKSVTKLEIPDASSEDSQGIVVDETVNVAVPSTDGNAKPAAEVDEEERWLEALESGRLDEVDEELRRMKDPNLMTARQRALLESKTQKDKEEVVLAPLVSPEKEISEEMIQRKMLRAKKRREQAEEKREKDKKQTIERLLKKTDVKSKLSKMKQTKKSNAPKMTYINNQETILLLLPPGQEYPLTPKVSKLPPSRIFCGVKGCKSFKKYSCSKTGIPLCSLECYKKNLKLM